MSEKKKERLNVSMSKEAIEKAEHLAALEVRSFSNLLEALITREYERVVPSKATDEHLLTPVKAHAA